MYVGACICMCRCVRSCGPARLHVLCVCVCVCVCVLCFVFLLLLLLLFCFGITDDDGVILPILPKSAISHSSYMYATRGQRSQDRGRLSRILSALTSQGVEGLQFIRSH